MDNLEEKRSWWKWLFFGLEMVFTVLSLAYYFYLTIQGTALPQTYTWLVIVCTQTPIAIAEFRNEGGLASWGIAIGAGLCLLLFVTSVALGGYVFITPNDMIMLLFIFITIAIWMKVKNDFLAVVLLSVIDSAGYYFTAKKIFFEPGSEVLSVWIMLTLSCLFAALAVDKFNKENITYPVTTTITGTIICVMIALIH
ncbi:MAG TPA: hypothetical protein VHQ20_00080 [Patescibacteria group bacterium]|nr:hypothetical protein [Patescibacteria group bacterium]